jgi:hypothetical protein
MKRVPPVRSAPTLRRRPDRGQALAFFVLVLPALLVVLGLGLDGANLYAQRRSAQAAADLAALAGARYLPDERTQAIAIAREVAGLNGWGTTVDVTTPYNGSDIHIEVQVRQDVPTFLLGFVRVDSFEVGARAVARNDPQATGGYAVFANRTSCAGDSEKTIDWSGSSTVVTGMVHSNAGILMGGSSNRINGGTTYTCTGKFVNSGGSNVFTPAVARVGTRSLPVTYNASSFACTWPSPGVAYNGLWDLSTDGPWWVNGQKSSKQLRPGVYCASGPSGGIRLSDSDISGNVTFIATQTIEISGSNFNLTPYASDLLFFSQGTSDVALKVAGSAGSWQGIMYAPNGNAEVSGSNNLTISGGIIADTVKLNGSSFNIVGTAGQAIEDRLRLVD